MGLDITAYEKLTYPQDRDQQDLGREYEETWPNNIVRLWVNDDFPAQADKLQEGYYLSEGKEIGFRAGSYGGYNVWRRWLAALVGTTPEAVWADPQPGPFVELINFSDFEGVIGPETSAKLAADFDAHLEVARTAPDPHGYNFRLYEEWRTAFHLATGSGAVRFH